MSDEADIPLPAYPRPQLVRANWSNLNGRWNCAITSGEWPIAFDRIIVVPFSPEAPLSGVGHALQPDEVLWYRRRVGRAELPTGPPGSCLVLHFGAVDQECVVFAGRSRTVVGRHLGGYLPLSIALTPEHLGDLVDADGSLEITVRVTDESDAGWRTRGKQRRRRGGIWYTPQSGIWQTVWMEAVPAEGIRRLVVAPHLERVAGTWVGALDVLIDSTSTTGEVEIAGEAPHTVRCGVVTRLPVPQPRPWSPEDPYLYDLTITCGADRVTSYAALRTVGMAPGADGVPRLLLNGAPYFHKGVLDQGYWPDGMYTAPTDAALEADVRAAKDLGFTMIRKHVKVEPLRWYHHCDRLGMLVWQDMPNGGRSYRFPVITIPAFVPMRLRDNRYGLFGRRDAAGRAEFLAELTELVEHLRSVPCIVGWVPFNEGWGQFDAVTAAAVVTTLDPTRHVDHASGWHDQGGGDIRSLHVYFRRFRMPRGRGAGTGSRDRRAVMLSEYGGYNLRVEGHTWGEKNVGYRRASSAADLLEKFGRLHREQIEPAVAQGLSGIVYTQLTDVEDELNGLLTHDRVDKLDRSAVRTVLDRLG